MTEQTFTDTGTSRVEPKRLSPQTANWQKALALSAGLSTHLRWVDSPASRVLGVVPVIRETDHEKGTTVATIRTSLPDLPERRRRNRFRKGFCRVTGKKRFRDHRSAVRALHLIAAVRDDGSETHHERRSYFCYACKGHHLTSWMMNTPSQGGEAA